MPQRKEPIAIVGSACHFPGTSDNPSKLWELLKEPRDLLQTIPADRFNAHAWYHPDSAHHGTANVTQSYFLSEDPATFDAQFFSIPPNECTAIDPQQRMLLETVYESLCAAGITMESLRGSSTACYVGQMCDDWSGMMMKDWESLPQYAATGISRSIMANRVSYFFDWHGPSMTIDTACSSSLVAVHEAVQFLRNGESDVAVACGANLILSPGMYIAESKLKMLSPDGRSRMWDQDANGYARGEGIAAVVLKTLSQAIKDGDHVDCIIRETGFNQDGRTTGITMPNNTAQTTLIRDTYIKSGLDPLNPIDRPQFFHAHGTGTPAGDPQEAEAISRAFFKEGEQPADNKLYVGSIKTVIGHTEGTAGLASLIGTSLALQNKTIPPNMHLTKLADKVAPFCTNLEVPTSCKAWPSVPAGQPLRASVNSFGFGGANAHAILEGYDDSPIAAHVNGVIEEEIPLFTPLTFSANSEKSLREMLASFSRFLGADHTTTQDIRDVAWTLQNRRSALACKTAVSGRMVADVVESIDAATQKNDNLGIHRAARPDNKLTVLGVFTGQGAQWPTMGSELIKASPYVRSVITKMDKSLQGLPDSDRPNWSIKDELEASKEKSRLTEAALSQPLCTAVQIVLVDMIQAAGVKFKAVVGHSSGEIAAAYATGVISAFDAIRIAYYRGLYAKLAASPSGKKGAMMAVGTSLEDAEQLCCLEQFMGRLTIAAINAAASVTLSGDEDAIDEAQEILKDESKFARKLKVDTAYHSFHMLRCSEQYLKAMEKCNIKFREADSSIAWYSSVLPGTIMSRNTVSNQYWADNMKNSVLFSQAVLAAVEDSDGPFDLAIEVGPHPALKGPCQENIEQASGVSGVPYTGLLERSTDDVKAFSAALGYIWERFGASSVDFDGYDKLVTQIPESNKMALDLPPYPWDHDRTYWTKSRVSSNYIHREAGPHPVLGVKLVEGSTGPQIQWMNILSPKEISWISGHRLQGQNVFPASGYVCMAVEAIITVAEARNRLQLIELEDFVIRKAIAFADDSAATEVIFTLSITTSTSDLISANFQISSCPKGDINMSLNASGSISVQLNGGGGSVDALTTAPIPQFNMRDVEIDRFYNALDDMGYNYAPPFKAISSIRRRTDAAVGDITDVRGTAWEDDFLMHPGFVDSSFQTVFAAFCSPGDERLWAIHVPTNIKRLSINPSLATFAPGEQAVWPWQSAITSGPHSSPRADIEVFAKSGKDVLMQIEGALLVPLVKSTGGENDCHLFSNFVYELAGPAGEVAGASHPTELDIQLAKASERFSFYWIRQVLSSVTPEEEMHTLAHYQRMLKWCRFVSDQVTNGEHPSVGPEACDDTLCSVEALVEPYGRRVDVELIRVVGQNLPHVIRTQGNIVEYMVKDGILDAFYEEGLGLYMANEWQANMVAQVAHRYPHMNIIEIGGGTGGSTRMVLPKLGKAFSTYTFTDISSGFFETAEERFAEFADRMVFSTFDMEKDISEQGYVEGHYDMVLASNVLHIGPDLDQVMSNVRRLIKPGGWLINLETVTYYPSLRAGFPMSGLPGWWCGAETGRPWGPTIPVEEWDRLYKRTGWSGVDTFTPHFDELHNFAVMATQAVDSRIDTLRLPLVPSEHADTKHETLAILGGGTNETARIVTELTNILSPHFDTVSNFESIDVFVAGSVEVPPVVLNLCELDEPIMKELMDNQPQKLVALKEIFYNARDILWITQNNRSANPHSRMLVGMARTLRKEYPRINFKSLDVDALDSRSVGIFAETLLQHRMLSDWNTQLVPGTIQWSQEPELHLEGGRIYVPRLKPVGEMNDRYNSTKRTIKHFVPTSNSSRIELVASGDTYELHEPSPLKPTPEIEGDAAAVRVSKSLLQSVNVPVAGHCVSLCYGTDECGEPILGLSDSREPVVYVPKDWTIPYSGSVDPGQVLLSVAANLLAHAVIAEAPANSVILVHDPDPIVAAALSKQAASKRSRVFFTTSHSEKKGGSHWIYIHPRTPRRLLERQLPKGVSMFVKLSGSQDERIVTDISNSLPSGSKVSTQSTFFGKTVMTMATAHRDASRELVANFLSTGWRLAKATNFAIPDSRPALPLADVPGYTDQPDNQLIVVDWDAGSNVPLNVQPIGACDNIFNPDKTYFMVGLSGEVGQSLTQWMVRHGARYVVLTSRNPNVNPEWIENLEDEFGAVIKIMALDITDRDALHACYHKICRTMPPIAGVAHGAMVLVDSLFQDMDYEDLMTVLRPKILGASYLDELFSENTLDFFILFSSITGIIGNPGQSNYTGANFFMDALGLQRRQRGLAASVICISSLVGIGYVERSENFDADYFSRSGYRNVSEQDVHMLFAEAIVRGRPEAVGSHEVITGVIPRYADESDRAAYLQDVKFSHLALERTAANQEGGAATQIPVRIQLQSAATEYEAREIMQAGFTKRIKKILRIPEEDEFSATASLVEQGVDSLVAVDIRSWFLKEAEIDIPVLKVLGGASISDLLHEALQRIPSEVVPQLRSEAPIAIKESVNHPAVLQVNSSQSASQPAPVMNGDSSLPKNREGQPNAKPVELWKRQEGHVTAEREYKAAENSTKVNGAGQNGAKTKPSGEWMIDENDKDFEALRHSEVTDRMSFGQSRFWFLNQVLKDKTTFNMAIMVRLEGRIRVQNMEKAVQEVVLNHEALRSRYYATGEYMEELTQGVIPTSTVKLKCIPIRDESDAYKEFDEIKSHVWDLGRWDTMKISLLSSSETMHYLVIGCHHIGMDGFSFNLFFEHLEKAYKGQKLPRVPESAQYRAFTREQREHWESGHLNEDLEYYRRIIPNDIKPLPLFPFARSSTRLPLDEYGTHRAHVYIDASLTSKINAASRRLKSTAFHFYLATLQALIFRQLRDCDDFFVGVADANRTDNKFMNTLGFFLNLLPLRLQRNAAKTFGEVVQQVRAKAYTGLAHSRLPFDVLLEQLEIPRSTAYTPLFQVFVDYRQGVQEKQKYMGLNAVGESWHLARTGYDLTLDVIENVSGDSRLEFRLQQGLYTEENAKLLLDGYVNLLTAFANNPEIDWNSPDVWRKETMTRAVNVGRGDAINYNWGPTVVHRIDDIIEQHSSNIALKDGTGRLMTYSQMARRVNAICSALIDANAVKGARVAVFQEPTADWICSLLAILRAAAVYVPLDLRSPLPRLAAVVNEAKSHAILAHDQTWNDVESLDAPEAKAINVSDISDSGKSIHNVTEADAPAVILFTSGSTGTPKGIQINHANIIKQLEGYSKQYNIQASAGYVLQQSAYSFDKSIEQIFTALVHGGALYVVPAEQRGDPVSVVRLIASEGISHTSTTPSEYLMWFRYARTQLSRCKSWKCAHLGGEVVTEALLDEFRSLGMPVRLLNSYGPAEITMSCAKADVPYHSMAPGEPIPAGLSLPNYSAYIVDENLRPVPPGISGEIVISGVGVASGYINSDKLTKQKFIRDDFSGSGTVFRTGDKGRLSENGMLFCEGRLDGDTQIKLRGVRMELEDIEYSILQTANGALTGAVVSLRGEQDSTFLVAHVVFSPTHTEHHDDLVERLPALLPLPQYMIPAVFIKLETLPLTTHLKVDRKTVQLLPIPEQDFEITMEEGELTMTESRLVSLWRQIIPRAPGLGVNTDFFHAGGNSLLLVKLQAMIREAFNLDLRLMDIMNSTTIGNMARTIDDAVRVKRLDWDAETMLPELPLQSQNGERSDIAPRKHKDLVVVLTGATGQLGRNMLASLSSDPRVSKIYAVAVRPQGRSANERVGAAGKVTVKPGDLDHPRLGLSEQEAAEITSEVDVIFHFGANRSFWDSYYELRSTNVSSVKEVIKMANTRKIPVHFVSSGEVSAYASTDPPADGSDGYVASKWAAEKVLTNAATQLGLETVVHRLVKTPDISDAPPDILEELVTLAKKMRTRPVLDGLSGSVCMVPVESIISDIWRTVFEVPPTSGAGGSKHVTHTSALNVDIGTLAGRLGQDDETLQMDGVPAIKWMGMAKKMGWSQFMIGQEILMSQAGNGITSRR